MLPHFAEVTLLTSGPAPVPPETTLATHTAPAGTSRTQSVCWSLGTGFLPRSAAYWPREPVRLLSQKRKELES